MTNLYWVYILHCHNDSYYTGYTTQLMQRYKHHLAGRCKYTRSFKPLGIAQAWKINGTKSIAMKIEHHIKKLTRQQKLFLIANPENLSSIFQGLAEIVVESIITTTS